MDSMMRSWLLAAALVGSPAPGATSPVTPQALPVIAQGLIELTGDSYTWSHTPHEVAAATLTIETDAPTFLLPRSDGTVVLTPSDGASGALLARGEATFSPDSAVTWTAIALAESSGEAPPPAIQLDAVALVPAEPGDGAFAPGAGWHDLELRHVELPPGGSLAWLTGNPVFALVIGGSVADAAGATIETGGSVVLARADMTLSNAAEQPVTLALATIGPVLDTVPGGATAATTSPPPPPPPAETTTPTTETPIDLDGDGLSDDEEAALGTDHNDPDSDDDDLTDGEEVETYGTNPLSKDTDGDELPDAGEVITYGSDPLDTDTDDDGLLDIEPVNWGTSPTNPDTDDDGLNDGQEVNDYGTDPHVTDSDGDSLSDGDEVNTWGSDPTDTDSDGDGLVDGEEVNGTNTDPAVADSDGDGIDDGEEAGDGTDPNDANDP